MTPQLVELIAILTCTSFTGRWSRITFHAAQLTAVGFLTLGHGYEVSL
jgi:hypothetical protein